MKINDILEKINQSIYKLNYGNGLYMLAYPAFYEDGDAMTIAIKIENETEVVLERGEEQENMGLLSTSDEYTITDLGAVVERYANVEGIDQIIERACDKYKCNYADGIITLDADTETTIYKLNRFVKCMWEIERLVSKTVSATHSTNDATAKLMAYLNKKTQ